MQAERAGAANNTRDKRLLLQSSNKVYYKPAKPEVVECGGRRLHLTREASRQGLSIQRESRYQSWSLSSCPILICFSNFLCVWFSLSHCIVLLISSDNSRSSKKAPLLYPKHHIMVKLPLFIPLSNNPVSEANILLCRFVDLSMMRYVYWW